MLSPKPMFFYSHKGGLLLIWLGHHGNLHLKNEELYNVQWQ